MVKYITYSKDGKVRTHFSKATAIARAKLDNSLTGRRTFVDELTSKGTRSVKVFDAKKKRK